MSALSSYAQERISHWNDVCLNYNAKKNAGSCYHKRLFDVFRYAIAEGSSILELGCGRGDLLASLKPSRGVGIDFSDEFIRKARENHPNYTFINADAHDFKLDVKFDYIILSDLVNDAEDVQNLFLNLRQACKPETRIIINYYSHLWEKILTLAGRLGLKTPVLEQNWLTTSDLKNLFFLAEFDLISSWQEILSPIWFPLLSGIANRYLAKLWPFRYFALSNFMIARPVPQKKCDTAKEPTVTVVIPAKNEAVNIERIFERTPEMGEWTELVFVEGHSRDKTYEAIQKAIKAHPERKAKVFRQSGKGKADAVRLGFKEASGDILMILDADMTVAPECHRR